VIFIFVSLSVVAMARNRRLHGDDERDRVVSTSRIVIASTIRGVDFAILHPSRI